MADEPADRSVLTTRSQWFVDRLSDLLDADEREAVRGDLTELGLPHSQTLREVLGLVVRRQAALWKQWGPWLALVGVVAPLGILLSHVSEGFAYGSAIYAFMYVNNWTWGYLESPGARRDLVEICTGLCLNSLALISWSWASGFVLGSVSRRTLWVTATLFILVLIEGSSWARPVRVNPFHAAIFSLPFYDVVYPWLALTVLVLLPAGCGMRRSRRPTSLPVVPVILGAVAVALLTTWATRGVVGSWHVQVLYWPLHLRLLPVVMVWPVAYIVARTCLGRLHRQSTSS